MARSERGRYEIRLKGELDPSWSAWLGGLEIVPGARGETVLSGPVVDQAALHGLLSRVRDLGLMLLSVNRVDPVEEQEGLDQ